MENKTKKIPTYFVTTLIGKTKMRKIEEVKNIVIVSTFESCLKVRECHLVFSL